MADLEDTDIVIVLPLKTWRAVVAHLQGGIHRDVDPIIKLMGVQSEPQIALAQRDAAARAAAETAQLEQTLLRGMEAAAAATAAAAAPTTPNNGAEEAVDQPIGPSSLH